MYLGVSLGPAIRVGGKLKSVLHLIIPTCPRFLIIYLCIVVPVSFLWM